MCGIVGVMSFGDLEDNKTERIRQEAMIFLATELLQLTQTRGKDATGVANLFSDGNFFGLKMGIPSLDFIARFGEKETDYDGFLKVWRDNFSKRKKPVKTFIGHCRKTSIGMANDNMNNHPVAVGDIVGVHNGTLSNHDHIFKMLKCDRNGEVDSEAIVRLIHHLTKKGSDPFSLDVLRETCNRLHGTYSCIMLNGNSPNQVATFRDSRPAEIAIIKPLGIGLIASDVDFLRNALFRYQKMAKLYATSVKFPSLSKTDVIMKALVDDHAYIWDLSAQITKKTEIVDLCVSERIARTDKLWSGKKDNATFTRYPNQNQNWANRNKKKANAVGSNTSKKAEVDAKPATGDKGTTSSSEEDSGKEPKPSARIWNKKVGGYERKEGIENTKKIGAVEIDTGINGSITSIMGENVNAILNKTTSGEGKKKDDLIPLEVVFEKDINSLIGDPVKIIDLPFPLELGETSTKINESNMNGEITTLDLKTDPEAMKKATEMATSLSKFENDDEVIAALDANPETIKEAPLYAIANRIIKRTFEEVFAWGYVTRKNEEKEGSKKELTAEKITKRDKLFIILK